MVTRPVRIEFMCGGTTPLIFTHNLPSSLIEKAQSNPSAQDPEFMNAFASVVKPIVTQHTQAVFAACQRECCICKAPATHPTLTPMSWLHNPDPFINVLACPVCPKPSCDTGARQNIQMLMAQIAGAPVGTEGKNKAEAVIGEVMPCNVCNKGEKTFKCGRCKIAFYCGRNIRWMIGRVIRRLARRSLGATRNQVRGMSSR
ncbi:hypothetical protein BKA65DRAFT_477791 [Rhexocercosporidium sp. MPI-PUGE-AT-0058]|nr:hypothetical protein BKA65DRAFT_477791 [Rhexocercosporidium sp. MPI-PUGE-AT-0058]